MKLGLINSAWVQANQPVAFGLQKTKEIDFDCVDIFIDPLEASEQERRLIKSPAIAYFLNLLRGGRLDRLQSQRSTISPGSCSAIS